jgi:hypothetical protein
MEIKIETTTMREIGQNILASEQDGMLILVIDTSKEMGLSSTGKMMGIASTSGFIPMPGGLKGNLWLGKKA